MGNVYRDICPQSDVRIDCLVMGLLGNNVYVVGSREKENAGSGSCFLVDPSCKPDFIEEYLAEFGHVPQEKLGGIVLTHYHFDHVGAARALRERTGAPTFAHEADAEHIAGILPVPVGHLQTEPCPVDIRVKDGEELMLAGLTWKVLHTPGHSPGSMCLYCAGREGRPGVLIAGDTLFAGGMGRTDFSDGNYSDMLASLGKLRVLPGDTYVLPGHGDITRLIACEDEVFIRYLGNPKSDKEKLRYS